MGAVLVLTKLTNLLLYTLDVSALERRTLGEPTPSSEDQCMKTEE